MNKNKPNTLLSDDWTNTVKKLEQYFVTVSIPAVGIVYEQVDFFVSNLRWTTIVNEGGNKILIAYADQISYDLESEKMIKILLKNALLELFGLDYEVELVPVGETLDQVE